MADNTQQYANRNGTNSTLADLKQLFSKLKAARNPFEPDWYLNVAYFKGDQWCFWNNGRVDRPKLGPNRILVTDNRILPISYSRISRKVKNRPTFTVSPNSYSEDDLNAAELGEKVLEDDWNNIHLSSKLFTALQWADICAAGFWKVYWDKYKGDSSTEYVVAPTGQAYTEPQSGAPIKADSDQGKAVLGIEGFRPQQIAMGDICVDVLSPFNFYPDPLAESIDECELVIEEHIRSKEYVKKNYNVDIEPDTDVPSDIATSRSFPNISSDSSNSSYKGITIYELWGKSGSTYGGEGKRCVWAKNKILLEETLQNSPFEGCPYVMFPGVEVPGRFWPTAITTQLRGPQTDLNKVKSQIRENGNRFGNPSMALSRQAQVSYSGVPGEKIFYDSTVPDAIPSFVVPPPIPAYVENQLQEIENSFTEISGMHEVSKATVPSGVTAASAINLLQEADDTRLGPEIQAMELALGHAGEKILKLRAKYQDDARLIRSAGEDGDWDITSYRGVMSKENTNVEVQAGSALPKSKAAKQAAMTELLQTMIQYGVEFKPRDLRKFLREYGVGGLDSMFAGLSNDEFQIKREHMIMRNGQALMINEYDDDDYHIEGHDEFRKGKVYWMLDPGIKQIIDLHVAAHRERRTQAVDAQVQAQQQQAMQEQQLAAQM